MAITLYPFHSIVDDEATYQDPIATIDHLTLAQECQEIGLAVDWWFDRANTVHLKAGCDTSEAFLLLTKSALKRYARDEEDDDLPSLWERVGHRITLTDQFNEDGINTDGWALHSARAIDGSSEEDDPNAVFLARFVDRRFFSKRHRGALITDGSSLINSADGFNITSVTEDIAGMTLDPAQGDEFPYVDMSLNGGDPYSWEQLLEILWNTSGMADRYAGALPGNIDPMPSGGTYPDSVPLDIRFDNRPAWEVFCDLLHSTGNEIYPLLDGTFYIARVDTVFVAGIETPSPLLSYKKYLVEQGHPHPNWRRLPSWAGALFQVKSDGYQEETLAFTYVGEEPFDVIGSDPDDSLEISGTDMTDWNATWIRGSVGEEEAFGVMESYTLFGMTSVRREGSTLNAEEMRDYARFTLKKYMQSRISQAVDATYGLFVPLAPGPEYQEVLWFIDPVGGPATKFMSVLTEIGVDEMPDTGTGGSGGGGSDRLVAADDDDEFPKTLIEKIEDVDNTYNPEEPTHALVYAYVIPDGGSETGDNTVRFWTIGVPGPAGDPGDPGDPGPTYTGGCGIIIAGDVLNVDADELLGVGMQMDPAATTTCSISPDPSALAGCGLASASDNAANDTVKLKVDPTALAGCGLASASNNQTDTDGPCKLRIDPTAIVGCGLAAASDNQTDGDGPCKIKLNPAALVGDGSGGLEEAPGNQTDGDGPCKIQIKTNVTVKIPTDIELEFVGNTLEVRLHYQNYQIYGVAGATGTLDDAVPTTDC